MSDSRITQVVAEVSAAVELLTNARSTIHQLLSEEPGFATIVQRGLRESSQALYRADIVSASGLERLRAIDFLENGTPYVPTLHW